MAIAVLLGGCSGRSLKRITRKMQGTVTMQAYMNSKFLTSWIVLVVSLIKNPGTAAPRVIDNKVNKMPVNETILTDSDLNQFTANLLGVFNTKILPIAARADPIKQKIEFSFSMRRRSHTPVMVKTAPTMKLILIPFLLMSQLQGKAKRGCAIVNSNAFMVTSRELMANIDSTATLMLEKVCTGIEFTKAANKQVASTTKRYGSWGYQVFSNIGIIEINSIDVLLILGLQQ